MSGKWRSILLAVFVAASSVTSSCTESRTINGRDVSCVGIDDDRDPRYTYKVSWWNAAMAIVFIETIIVPIVILGDSINCPVAEVER